MFSGFIFDVEGTLVDSVAQHLHSLQDALERFGHRVPYQTLQLYSGLDGDQTLQLILPEATENERNEILQKRGAIFEGEYLLSVKPFDGARDLFRALIEHGGKIAIATDCKGRAFKRYLSLLNASEFITATACGDDVEHGKPDPRLVGMALRKLDLPAPQAVMIGDTPYDAEAALEAGAKAAGAFAICAARSGFVVIRGSPLACPPRATAFTAHLIRGRCQRPNPTAACVLRTGTPSASRRA